MSYHQRPHELRLAISPKRKRSFPILAVMLTLKLAGALEASSDSLARDWSVVGGDDRSQVGQALIRARRLIRLNRRPLIRGHGAT